MLTFNVSEDLSDLLENRFVRPKSNGLVLFFSKSTPPLVVRHQKTAPNSRSTVYDRIFRLGKSVSFGLPYNAYDFIVKLHATLGDFVSASIPNQRAQVVGRDVIIPQRIRSS